MNFCSGRITGFPLCLWFRLFFCIPSLCTRPSRLAEAILESLLIAVRHTHTKICKYIYTVHIWMGVFFLVRATTFCLNQRCVFIYQLVTQCVQICPSRFGACLCVGMCVLWGWCGMRVTSVRSNVQPVLWCEGHCQETTTRQRRYSCPQCSFPSVAHTQTNTPMLPVNWHTAVGKPSVAKNPQDCALSLK